MLSYSVRFMEQQHIQPLFTHINPYIAVHHRYSSRLILSQIPANLVCKLTARLSAGLQIPFDFLPGFSTGTGLISVTNSSVPGWGQSLVPGF